VNNGGQGGKGEVKERKKLGRKKVAPSLPPLGKPFKCHVGF